MNSIVREIQGEEIIDIMNWLPAYGLNPTPPLPDEEERREIFKNRKGATFYACFEDDKPVACAASTRMSQNVRGKIFPMAGIWGVATHPAARRKGYQRDVIRALMTDMHSTNLILSTLYPFRGSFYERLGYITFPVPRKAIFDPTVLIQLVKEELVDNVEMMLLSDGYDIYREYLKTLQMRTHGMGIFEFGDKSSLKRHDQWLAIVNVNGKITGVMLYDIKGEFPTKYTLRVTRFYYDSSQTKYALLAWVAKHIDQANRVELYLPPYEYPETWMSDLRATMEPVFFPPMGRIITINGIAGMSTSEGSFTVRIQDDLCPWNDGTWKFSSSAEGLRVSAGEHAECKLRIQGMSALVYGTHDPGDFEYLGWGNPSSSLQSVMREMFPNVVPYLHEMF